MVSTPLAPSQHPLAEYIHRLEQGQALLKDTPGECPGSGGVFSKAME